MKNNHCEGLRPIREGTDIAGVSHVLACLFDDRQHNFTDEVVKGLTFLELIGVLLGAKDRMKGGKKPSREEE